MTVLMVWLSERFEAECLPAVGVEQEGILPGMIKDRYSTYSKGVGKKIRDGKVSLWDYTCLHFTLTHKLASN